MSSDSWITNTAEEATAETAESASESSELQQAVAPNMVPLQHMNYTTVDEYYEEDVEETQSVPGKIVNNINVKVPDEPPPEPLTKSYMMLFPLGGILLACIIFWVGWASLDLALQEGIKDHNVGTKILAETNTFNAPITPGTVLILARVLFVTTMTVPLFLAIPILIFDIKRFKAGLTGFTTAIIVNCCCIFIIMILFAAAVSIFSDVIATRGWSGDCEAFPTCTKAQSAVAVCFVGALFLTVAVAATIVIACLGRARLTKEMADNSKTYVVAVNTDA